MIERGQMTFYKSFWDAISGLPKKDQLPVFRAVVSYGLSGFHQESLSPTQNAFFTLMQPVLDSSRNKASNRKQTENKPKTNCEQNGKEKEKEGENEKEKENEYESEYENDSSLKAHTKKKRVSYGSFGWVKLTEEEHSKLVADLGETELNRCIAYVDESAQSTGNKNKWRDWNLVLRKCSREGWGLNRKGRPALTNKGASGALGNAEIENIRRLMEEG